MADEAKIWTKEGYTAVKFGWGQTRDTAFGLDAEKDEAAVKCFGEGSRTRYIMVDVGRYVNWTPAHALEMARRFSKYGIYWLEESLPQDDIEGFIWLTERSPVKIATGKEQGTASDSSGLSRNMQADIIQPDVGRAVLDGRDAHRGSRSNLEFRLVPHGFSSAINVAANLQWIPSMPRGTLCEFRRTKSPLMAELIKDPL